MKNILKTTLLAGVFATTFSAFAEISVIVHPSNSAELSKEDITRIFLGKQKSFSGGGSAVPISQDESSKIYEDFNTTVTNKTNSQLKAYWSKLVFTGKGTPPKTVSGDSEVIDLISNNPSLIGYVDSSSVTGNVKVVGTF
jgi:ABC-type phosphate transport system substrate-binding protein